MESTVPYSGVEHITTTLKQNGDKKSYFVTVKDLINNLNDNIKQSKIQV